MLVDRSTQPRRGRCVVRALSGIGLALGGLAGVAWACADTSCEPDWRLASPGYACAGRAVISPGNDTRINLLLLMRSIGPVITGGGTYPRPEWDERWFGHSFLSWHGLRATFWPHPEAPDAVPAEPEAACATSSKAQAAFGAALAAESGLAPAERAALARIHARLGCSGTSLDPPVTTASGRDYLAYLKAAAAFHAGNWAAARSGFAALAHARSRWLAEIAAYMPIRIGLRAAVATSIDQYGDFAGVEKVDAAAVSEARTAIATYLKTWPQGRYADSARGLTRRVLWLEGNRAELARTYERMLEAMPADREAAADLVEEIDLRLLGSDSARADIARAGDAPLLLAIADLKAMRVDEAAAPLPLTAADLAAQQGQFAAHAELFGFLQASRSWYAGDDPRAILAMIPDASHAPRHAPLAFSRQVLRGMALARAHDPNEAGFWKDLLAGADPLYQRPLVELGLAVRWQHDQRLDAIFAPGSPIADATTREVLLQTVASPPILRSVAGDVTRSGHERDIARFTLLYKDLGRGAYADFGRDLALVPANANLDAGLWNLQEQDAVPVGLFARGKWSDGYDCPPLAHTTAALARSPADRGARLCLGDFWRLNGFDTFSLFASPGGADRLGAGRDAFPGTPLPRAAIYAAIIGDRQAPPGERAYALYRAVMCYAPSGYNGCAGPYRTAKDMAQADVPKAQRQAWFLELKARYPETIWARSLRYYW